MVVMELRYADMTIQTYLDSRIAKVGSELADVERDLTGCIQPADWTEFAARASKKMDKAYAAFCSSIYWGIVRGAYGGLRSFGMASSSESYSNFMAASACWLSSQATRKL